MKTDVLHISPYIYTAGDFKNPYNADCLSEAHGFPFYFVRIYAGAGRRASVSVGTPLLLIVRVSGKNMIGVENGYHDQRCESCGKTAVKENESPVHARGG